MQRRDIYTVHPAQTVPHTDISTLIIGDPAGGLSHSSLLFGFEIPAYGCFYHVDAVILAPKFFQEHMVIGSTEAGDWQ